VNRIPKRKRRQRMSVWSQCTTGKECDTLGEIILDSGAFYSIVYPRSNTIAESDMIAESGIRRPNIGAKNEERLEAWQPRREFLGPCPFRYVQEIDKGLGHCSVGSDRWLQRKSLPQIILYMRTCAYWSEHSPCSMLPVGTSLTDYERGRGRANPRLCSCFDSLLA
jgi:hypothetical protein